MHTSVDSQFEMLAAFAPGEFPVISVYLNTQSDDHGRDHFASFLKKELHTKAGTLEPLSKSRASFERDVTRIEKYLASELRPSSNGLALFACSGADAFFEAMQLNAPLQRHEIYVDRQPHLYPLALLTQQFPRYAAVIADADSARLFVFGLCRTISEARVEEGKPSRRQTSGWTQERYQRRMENDLQHHAKEVLEVLDRVVRKEQIQHIVFSGDKAVIALLLKKLSPFLAAKVVDVVRMDIHAPERRVLDVTLAAMRRHDAKDDAGRVERLIGDYLAGGLTVVGVADVLTALGKGQVEEVLLSTSLEDLRGEVTGQMADHHSNEEGVKLSEAILAQARQTGARLRLIEDATRLATVGGVGASLRYRE